LTEAKFVIYNELMKTNHYIIVGRVQGVFFRYSTKETAIRCSVKGTVKNLSNYNVEVYAQGGNIEEFEKFLAIGPDIARVDDVIKKEIEQEIIFADFSIIH